MSIQPELIQQFPWLPSLKTFYAHSASKDPIDFISEAFKNYSKEIQERVFNFFDAAFDNREELSDYIADDINIYLYLTLKMLLFVLNNKRIANRAANLYSKVSYNELIKEKNDSNFYNICIDLNLKILYHNPPFQYGKVILKDLHKNLETKFSIHFTDYLRLAANLRDDHRKLINNSLLNGYVYLQKKNLIRLIQEFVRKKIDDGKEKNKNEVETFKQRLLEIKGFKNIFNEITNKWELIKEDFEYSSEIIFKRGKDFSKSFPPCLKEVLTKAKEGQNLTHIERLFLVFLLHALNYPVEDITNIFATLPDFDRGVTTYQVKFAKEKGYTPHACKTLKSLGLCMAMKYKDKLCIEGYFSRKFNEQKKISHPLFYIQMGQFRTKNNQNPPKDQSKKEKNE